METVLYLSFVTASISFTVAETKLFRPLREFAAKRNAFLGNLLSCGYCFGHWVSFALVAIYRPKFFHFWPALDFFLTALVIAWIGGIQWAAMSLIVSKAGK
jgi:hypothetical protein